MLRWQVALTCVPLTPAVCWALRSTCRLCTLLLLTLLQSLESLKQEGHGRHKRRDRIAVKVEALLRVGRIRLQLNT